MKNYKYPLTSREETLRLIIEMSHFDPREETIPVKKALGRITSVKTLAINTLPNSPSSTMDGIAVKSINLNGEIPDTHNWQNGIDYVFSNTGVGIPDGFDTIVLIEDVEIDKTGELHISSIPKVGQNIHIVGSSMQVGEILIPAHFCLGPAQLGLLTAGGVNEVIVLAKPRVAILPTGNELVPAGHKLPRGKIVESNGILIESQVKIMGAEPRLYPITRDNPAELLKVLKDALSWADIIILNGGSSKGSDDRSIEVLETIGQIMVYEVDYGPGRHTTMTMVGDKPILGAVGPTMGAEYAIEWYVGPLINKYLYQPNIEPKKLKVKLLENISISLPFDLYIKLEVKRVNGLYIAKRIERSACMATQMMSNAYLCIPRHFKGYTTGQIVEVSLRWPLEWI